MKNSESGERILLVDDDLVTRVMLRGTLERHGFSVVEADGGDAALQLFQTHRPDIVLLDCMMPRKDGFATCGELRAMSEGEHVPVLMLTSLSDEDSVNRAYEAGATDFFLKSSQLTMLAQRVRYLLRSSRMREELAKSRSILAKAQQLARVGSWEWKRGEGIVFGSGECLRILGLGSRDAEVPEADFIRRATGLGCSEFERRVYSELRKSGTFHGEFDVEAAHAGVQALHVEAEVAASVPGGIDVVLGIIQDITDRRHAERELNRLANFDGLTGLPNRNLFRDRFERALARARDEEAFLAVLFIDLDRFKVVNDTLGHGIGDILLRQVAARLNRCVRGADSITRSGEAESIASVARLGGDEFIALLTGLKSAADATKVAERMLASLKDPIEIEGHEIWVSASIGMANFPADGQDTETLLMRADAAMYEAKAQGRNGHTSYSPSLDSRSLERFRLEADLRKALDRDELRLHYQPIVNVRNGKMVGCEVLMRWQRGDTLVPPNHFIPIAEENGLIIPMGEWAIETASKQLGAWHAQGLDPIYVSVNMPGSHFQQPDLTKMIEKSLAGGGLRPEHLYIEITETVVMKAVERTMRSLGELREMGVRISIDDFGTGYSSLAYLKRLPINTLKIDRSFVKDIAVDSDDEVIVSAIIGLARSLNMSVVAEGVETEAQMSFLNMFGASLMQGYLFSRPCPAAEFEVMLRRNGTDGHPALWTCPEGGNRVIHLFEAAGRKSGAAAVAMV